ncbi:MAG: glycosyltransferase family 2 protein [bacterium]
MMEKLYDVPLKPALSATKNMYLRELDSLNRTGSVSTDTYFGCFDCRAYAKYTNLQTIRACADVPVQLIHVDESGREIVLSAAEVELAQYPDGYLYVKAEGPTAIWYEGEGEAKPVRLAIIICTYKREAQVTRNLQILSDTMAADELLSECVEVYCVDNGQTVTNVPPGIYLIPNRNYGGSGGYAQGMMAASHCAYFWLMDDDITFEPTLLRRVVTFLKYRAEEVRLAAGLFNFETPTIQREATAAFDGYTFHSNCGGLDLSEKAALLGNKVIGRADYGGWWSMVVPNTDELPMPFFIKLDDVEFGLRQKFPLAIMNGFGVWHEAFGNKANAWSEYYTTRNTLILQRMYPELGHSAFKTMGIRLLKALAYDEPKCMAAALQGVEDYAKGAEIFGTVDPEENHRAVMRAFGTRLTTDMTRGKMIKMAMKKLLKPRNWRSMGMFARSLISLRKVAPSGWFALRTRAFWEKYLSGK